MRCSETHDGRRRKRKQDKFWEAIQMAIPRNYYNYFDVCKMEGIPEGTAKSAVATGLEGIAAMSALKPIGHLFKEFERFVKGGKRRQYGILRNHYDYWKKHGHAPKLSPGRPKKHKDCTEIRAYIPNNVYNEFKEIVNNANSVSVVRVSYRDMFSVAIQEFCQRRPQFKNPD